MPRILLMLPLLILSVLIAAIALAAEPSTSPSPSPSASPSPSPASRPAESATSASALATPATTPAATMPSTAPATTQRAIADKVAALIPRLSDPDFRVRDRATVDLVMLGEDADPLLKAALAREDLSAAARTGIEVVLSQSAEQRRIGPTLVAVPPKGDSAFEAISAVLGRGKLTLSDSAAKALRARPDRRSTPGPAGPESMWAAALRLIADAGMAVQSVAKDQVHLVPADKRPAITAANGPFFVTIGRVETNIRRIQAFPGPMPANANMDEWSAPPCKLCVFPFAEPRLQTTMWIVQSAEVTTDDAKTLTLINSGTSGRVNQQTETQIRFRGELAASRSLARVELKALMVRRTEDEHIESENPLAVKDQTKVVGGYHATIKQVVKLSDGEYEYKLAIQRDHLTPAEWQCLMAMIDSSSFRLLDEAGKPLMGEGGGTSTSGSEWSCNYRVTRGFGAPANGPFPIGEPKKLVWDLPKHFEMLPATFVFQNIPLQ